MKIFDQKEMCCGCTACFSICPKDAIQMKRDEEGFVYPSIDEAVCVDCGLCKRVCAFQKPKLEDNLFGQNYYAMRSKDDEILLESSSGGMFTVLSDYILQQGGVVFGAVFDDAFRVHTVCGTDEETRNRMRGSKYVQSDLNGTFLEAAEHLRQGKTVMFTGTPCQVAGVKSFLDVRNIDMEKLYLCDVVCHGVASPTMLQEYLHFVQTKFGHSIERFSFRNKRKGWKNMEMMLISSNDDYSEQCNKKYSIMDFYSSLNITRNSCYHCPYTTYKRVSDVTLADFWNIGQVDSLLNDNKGVSTVLVNSEKGNIWVEEIKGNTNFLPVSRKSCWQPHLEYSVTEPKNRKAFWNQYKEQGFEYVFKKYGRGTMLTRLIRLSMPALKKMGLYVVAGKIYKWVFKK